MFDKLLSLIERTAGGIASVVKRAGGASVAPILAAILLLGGFGYVLFHVFFPTGQDVYYFFVYQSPTFWYYLVVGIVLGGLALYSGHPGVAMGIGVVAILMALIIGPALGGVYASEHVANNQNFEETETLPNTSTDHVRVLPKAVADEYAQSSMQYPRYETGPGDISLNNGTYTWSYPLQPDKFMVQWQGEQHGAFFVNMEQQSKNVTIVEQEVEEGYGQLFRDNYNFQMKLDRMDVDHRGGSSFVFQHEGEIHIARPYVQHDWEWRTTPVPQPYSVPKFGGVMVMDSNGTITDVPADEVGETEMFDGQNVYPYDLAMFRVQSQQYQNGIWNKWFVGKDVPQFAGVAGQGNSQPFTVPTDTESGVELTYFAAAEPTGSGNGVYQIYTIDSHTGSIEYVEYDDTQLGPERAVNYVKKENPRVNWNEGDGGGSMEATEPIPVVRGDTLYWQVRIVPTDSTGMAYTAFVDAQSGDVTEVANDEEIYEFVQSGDAVEVDPGGSDGNQTDDGSDSDMGSNGTISVAIVENGTVVDTVEVNRGQEIVIESGNSTEA